MKPPVKIDIPANLQAIVDSAIGIRDAATAQSLMFNYVLNNGRPRDRHATTLMKLLEAAVELDHLDWPRDLKPLCQGKDVLDFGCGATLYGVVLRALGARSYTGVDRALELNSKKFRSRKLKSTVNIGLSLADVSRVIPALSYMRADDVTSRGLFDVVLLQSVTHMVDDLERLLAHLHRALRPNGEIWFLHENFHAWSGHQTNPKSASSFNPADPEQARMVDWGHVLFDPPADHRLRTNFNRMRLPEFRRHLDTYFEVDRWKEVPERSSIRARLTPARAKELGDYSEQELFTRQVIGSGRRRSLV